MSAESTHNERRLATWSPPEFPGKSDRLPDQQRAISELVFACMISFMGAALPVLVGDHHPAGVLWALTWVPIQDSSGFRSDKWRRCHMPIATRLERILAEEPASPARLVAIIRLTVDGHMYAQDTGVLSCIDGWLVFEGNRTHFAIASHDGSRLPQHETRLLNSEQIMLNVPGADVRLALAAAAKGPLGSMLWTWSKARVSEPAVSVLPPLEPLPGGSIMACAPTRRPQGMIFARIAQALVIVLGGYWLLGQGVSQLLALSALPLAALPIPLGVFALRFRGRGRALRRLADCRRRLLESESAGALEQRQLLEIELRSTVTPREPAYESPFRA